MNSSLSVKVVIGVVICLTLGFLSGMSTVDAIANWYSGLIKPSFNPPNWIFGPVWTVLYAFMGIVIGRAWHRGDTKGIKLFAVQFILNLLWSPVFFLMHQPLLALVIIITLWTMLIMCIRYWWRVDRLSAYLFVPYILWVSFATILNASIVLLN